MEVARRDITHSRPIRTIGLRWPQMPRYLRLICGVGVGVLILVASVIALARHIETLADPFAPFDAILPGQSQSILTEQGFSCQYIMQAPKRPKEIAPADWRAAHFP